MSSPESTPIETFLDLSPLYFPPERPQIVVPPKKDSSCLSKIQTIAVALFNCLFTTVMAVAAITPGVSTIIYLPLGIYCQKLLDQAIDEKEKILCSNLKKFCFTAALPIIGNFVLGYRFISVIYHKITLLT